MSLSKRCETLSRILPGKFMEIPPIVISPYIVCEGR
jgi:hypothetical protein